MRKIFHKLVRPEDVEAVLSRYLSIKPLGTEVVSIEEALGRVLAEDIHSPIDYPPFDRSIVDGYAVQAEDTFGADEDRPVKLRIKGYVKVGEVPKVEVGRGEAVEVATGAPIPKGANAVVMVEYTERRNDELLIYRSVAPGDGIATVASDVSAGDLVLRKGTKLGPPEISLLAGLGIEYVKVFRRVKVGIFSTGDEVIRPGNELRLGKVYDSNTYFLMAALKELGAEPHYVTHLPDDESVMIKELSVALREYDVILTSGGTSAGLGDIVYRVLNSLGRPGVIIHGLRIKPGKPTVFAVINGKLVVGLPGFPLSCAMAFLKVVRPIIAKLIGIELPEEEIVEARIPYRLRLGGGRSWLIPVSLVKTSNGLVAYPIKLSSGSISALTLADGYLYVSEGREYIDEGELVSIRLFSKSISIPELVFIGSHDIALWKLLTVSGLIKVSKVIPTGSLRGWYAIDRGEADIAPTHLLDEVTNEYNIPYLSKLGLKGRAVIVRGYTRRVGLVVAKGNPKKIISIKDFLREDVVIVNRVKGSGIRVLTDLLLKRVAKELNMGFEELTKKINGYTYEVRTHTAVAAAVAQGRADVGIAAEVAARMYDLDFIPLTNEVVDFLILKERLSKKYVKEFIKLLKSELCRNILKSLPGYDVLSNTGEIIE